MARSARFIWGDAIRHWIDENGLDIAPVAAGTAVLVARELPCWHIIGVLKRGLLLCLVAEAQFAPGNMGEIPENGRQPARRDLGIS